MYRILVAEEDTEIRNLLVNILTEHGYKVIGVSNGEHVVQMLEREYINLLLCDVMLSEIDGYELTQILKEKNYDIPLLMFMSNLTSKHEKLRFIQEAQGLLDYRDGEAILCRLQQMLKETNPLEVEHIKFGDVSVDLRDLYVQIGNDRFSLTREEFLMFGKFIFFPNKIYTRMQLMENIREGEGSVNEQLFELYMRRVREIISHSAEVELKHIHGLGYKVMKRKENDQHG